MDDSKETHALEDIEARLRTLRAREDVKAGRGPRENDEAGAGMGFGFRVAVELVAGIAVGSFVGYCLDRWLGTKPWLMVVFFFLGAAAGVMNVYRAAKGLDDSVGLGQAKHRRSQRNGAADNE